MELHVLNKIVNQHGVGKSVGSMLLYFYWQEAPNIYSSVEQGPGAQNLRNTKELVVANQVKT